MRRFTSVLAATGLLAIATTVGINPGQAQATKKPGQTQKAAKAQYECTHCNIMSVKGGKCPKCQMAMTKMAPGKAAKAQYECKMCGIMSAKAGKCPKCGMAMTKMTKTAKPKRS